MNVRMKIELPDCTLFLHHFRKNFHLKIAYARGAPLGPQGEILSCCFQFTDIWSLDMQNISEFGLTIQCYLISYFR